MAKSFAPIRIGIVGLGRAGMNMHIPEIQNKEELYTIVAGCDERFDRADRVRQKFGSTAYTRIEDLLADDDVELVDIATRSADHFKHALMALKTGKHVVLEKPITLTYDEAKKLFAAAKKAKGKLFIRHNRRFEPTFVHIKEIIKSGILGQVYQIKLRRQGYQRRSDWQTIIKHGGGQLLNWGPHIIDHALQFLDYDVQRVWSKLRKVAAVGDAEDHLTIIMENKTGLVVDLEISGGVALTEPEYIIFGTKGSLSATENTIKMRYLDPDRKLPKRLADPGTPSGAGFGTAEDLPWMDIEMDAKPKDPAGLDYMWYAIFDSIRKGKKYPVSHEQSLEVMRIISLVKKGTKFA